MSNGAINKNQLLLRTCAIALKFQISMWMSGVDIILMYLEFVPEVHECGWQTSP